MSLPLCSGRKSENILFRYRSRYLRVIQLPHLHFSQHQFQTAYMSEGFLRHSTLQRAAKLAENVNSKKPGQGCTMIKQVIKKFHFTGTAEVKLRPYRRKPSKITSLWIFFRGAHQTAHLTARPSEGLGRLWSSGAPFYCAAAPAQTWPPWDHQRKTSPATSNQKLSFRSLQMSI